jgi:hypothetical protein
MMTMRPSAQKSHNHASFVTKQFLIMTKRTISNFVVQRPSSAQNVRDMSSSWIRRNILLKTYVRKSLPRDKKKSNLIKKKNLQNFRRRGKRKWQERQTCKRNRSVRSRIGK